MSKRLVFVDDSGDPGLKNASSNYFVIASAIFIEPKDAMLVMHEIDEYRIELGWRYNHEFKFTKNPKNVIIELLRRVGKYNFQVYAVYIEKKSFRNIPPIMSQFLDKEKLYNWTIKELLKDLPLESAKVTIDGRSSKQNMKNTKTYLRREIGNNDEKIEIKFDDSAKTSLLQLADIIAGSINRSLQIDKTDSGNYINIFKKKIIKIRKIDFR